MNIKQNLLMLKNNLSDLFVFVKNFDCNPMSLTDLRNIVGFYKRNSKYLAYENFQFFIYLESETDYFPEVSEKKLWNKENFHDKINELSLIIDSNINNIKYNINNIINSYFIFKYIVSLDCTGQIIYGKYLDNCIYIDKEQGNDLYNITMWNKDNNQEQQQFTFNSEKEVEDFFRENDMIVKWEKLEE